MANRNIPVNSVKKAFDLLSVLAFEDIGQQGIALRELAEKLNMPANTAHNILKTMITCGYVTQTHDRKYIIGANCMRIGANNYFESDVFKNRLSKVLSKYSAEIEEVLVFAVLNNGKRQLVAQSEPTTQIVRVDSYVYNQNISIYSLPTGRVMIANADNDEYAKILKRNGDIFNDWETYENDIREIRKQGYCEQDKPQLRACALAFRTDLGTLASIGCYAPRYRCGELQFRNILRVLRSASNELASKFHNVE